jgi:hypothetical protein
LVDGAKHVESRAGGESLAPSRRVGSRNVTGSLGWKVSANAIGQYNYSSISSTISTSTLETQTLADIPWHQRPEVISLLFVSLHFFSRSFDANIVRYGLCRPSDKRV